MDPESGANEHPEQAMDPESGASEHPEQAIDPAPGAEWWREFFDDVYLRLWAPLFSLERNRWELSALGALLEATPPPADVLDAGGGDGRVSRPLALAGYRVVLLDASAPMLARAAEAPGGDAVWRVQADLRCLPLVEQVDVVLNLSTSFGLFDAEPDHQRALDAMARSLRPGGLLILDTVHRDHIVSEHAMDRAWYPLDDGTPVLVSHAFDPISGRTREALHTVEDGALRCQRAWSLRLFTATEIAHMLRRAGLEPEAWYGDFDLAPFTPRAPRLLVVARKPNTGAPGRAGAAQEQALPDASPEPAPVDWRALVGRLVCPATGLPLTAMDSPALDALRARAPWPHALDGALARDDGRVAYPVYGGAPRLLIEAAIPLDPPGAGHHDDTE